MSAPVHIGLPYQIGSPYGGRGPMLMAIGWIGVILTSILVLARLYLRYRSVQQVREQDISMWIAILSWAIQVASNSLLSVAVHFGLGNHMANLTYPNIIMAFKYDWIAVALAVFSAGVSKASVVAYLLVLQRGSPRLKKWTWLLYFLGIINVILCFMIMFIMIYQCDPPESAWNLSFQGNCYAADHLFGPVGLVQSSCNAFTDLFLAIYPVFIVWPLKIPIRLKLLLCVIMGLGAIASAFSWVKLYQLVELIRQPPLDGTWELPIVVAWGYVENYAVLIALSIPPIWPLLKPYFADRITGSSSGSKRPLKGGSGSNNSQEWQPMKSTEEPMSFSLPSMQAHGNYGGFKLDNNSRGIRTTTEVLVTSQSYV